MLVNISFVISHLFGAQYTYERTGWKRFLVMLRKNKVVLNCVCAISNPKLPDSRLSNTVCFTEQVVCCLQVSDQIK